MPLISFISNFFIAYSPLLAVFLYIRKQPHLVLLSLASACVYMLSILVISFFYKIPGVGTSVWILISISTIVQEFARLGMYFGFKRLDPVLEQLHTAHRAGNNNTQEGQQTSTGNRLLFVDHDIAIGFGFATLASLLQYISSLGQSISPAHLGGKSCHPSISVFFIGALVTSIMSLLHILWTFMMFESARKSQWLVVIACFIIHWCTSVTTTLTELEALGNMGCLITVAILGAVLILHMILCRWYYINNKKQD